MAASLRRTAIGLILLLCAAPAGAMQCEGRLVEVGDSEDRVLNLCGEPTRRQVLSRGSLATAYGIWQQIPTDEWTYDGGPGQFVRHLLFENGTLEQVRQGGYADLD